MSERKVIGRIACPHCPPTEKLGTTPDGSDVTVSVNLFDVIGRDGVFWIVDCPGQHRVLKLFFTSSQEWIDGFENKGCFPVLKPVKLGAE